MLKLKLAGLFDTAVGWIAPFKRTITLAVIGIALAIAAVQTVHLEGFKVWPLSVEGWKPKAERLERDLANVRQAQAIAKVKARAARLEQEARYRALAERIDDNAKQDMGSAVDAAERFIAAGGVRSKAVGSDRIGTGTSPEGGSAGDIEGTSAAPVMDEGTVAVTPDDVRICTINTVKAEAAREWALGIEGVE